MLHLITIVGYLIIGCIVASITRFINKDYLEETEGCLAILLWPFFLVLCIIVGIGWILRIHKWWGWLTYND